MRDPLVGDGIMYGGQLPIKAGHTPRDVRYLANTHPKRRIGVFKGVVQPGCRASQCNPVTITISKADSLVNITFGIGINIHGRDPAARFRMAAWDSFPDHTQNVQDKKKGMENAPKNPAVVVITEIKHLGQMFEIETGYRGVNAR